MIKIVKANSTPDAPNYHYCLAGHELVFQERVHTLEAFLVEGKATVEMPSFVEHEILSGVNAQCVYQGRAPFEHRIQDIRFWQTGEISQIDVAGVPICQIDNERETISLLNQRSFDTQLNLEVLTGPACILLMARKRTFCLHASAVASSAGNILFIAESGSGKSTLAQHQGTDWNQLSDDISPLVMRQTSPAGQRVELSTRFPQLKLSNASVAKPLADWLQVDLIVRLGNAVCSQIEFSKLNSTDAFLQVIRHTVAAKLFNADQLSAQNEFAQKVAQTVPVFEINYPRDLQQLPELRQAIAGYLAEMSLP